MKIIGTGSALPEQSINNEDLTAFLDTSDEWIVSHTGIRQRRVLKEESVNDLALQAARRALEENVSCLIVCQAELPKELYELPTETCIIATPFDAVRTARM